MFVHVGLFRESCTLPVAKKVEESAQAMAGDGTTKALVSPAPKLVSFFEGLPKVVNYSHRINYITRHNFFYPRSAVYVNLVLRIQK